MPLKPHKDVAREIRIGVTTASRATRPCDGCAMFEWCEVADVACQDFGAWVLLDQHRSVRREPTPGLFNLIFEREDAMETSDLVDQVLYSELQRAARAAKSLVSKPEPRDD